ncbi:hypothetical protein A6R68_17691, partial [Neotoma lepida]
MAILEEFMSSWSIATLLCFCEGISSSILFAEIALGFLSYVSIVTRTWKIAGSNDYRNSWRVVIATRRSKVQVTPLSQHLNMC